MSASPPTPPRGGSRRGDALRVQIAKLQAKIDKVMVEAKVADEAALDAIRRRTLLTKAKVIGGGFLLKIPATTWTVEMRDAFRNGASGCRVSDREGWSFLLAELEKAWAGQHASSDTSAPRSPHSVADTNPDPDRRDLETGTTLSAVPAPPSSEPLTRDQLFKMTPAERRPYIMAMHPVLAQITDSEMNQFTSAERPRVLEMRRQARARNEVTA